MSKEANNSVIDAFDIGALDLSAAAEKGIEFELKHPVSKAGLGIFIGVLGRHGETFQNYTKEKADERMKADILANRKGRPNDPPKAQEVEDGAIELLTLCTTHWRSETYKMEGKDKIKIDDKPIIKLLGEELAFTANNVKKVYSKFSWIRAQVDTAIGDIELFIQG